MKPTCLPTRSRRRFPLTDFFFHSGVGQWRGYSSPDEGEGESRRFRNFSREFLLESAREGVKEMAVFALVAIVALWPVAYMVVVLVKLLLRGRPLD